MRKNWCRAVGTVMCILVLAGCANERGIPETAQATEGRELENPGQEQELKEYYISAEDDEEVPVIMSEYAEEAEYPALADFLISYYEIPEEYQSKTRYYYNYTDLNEDGTDEVIVLVVGDYTKVPFGNPALLLNETEDGFTVLESFAGIHTPVLVSDEMTNGWHDIIYNEYGRGAEKGYRICRYQPDGGYQTDLSEVVDEPEPVGGMQLLANNLIDDMDQGRYLTLAPQEKAD